MQFELMIMTSILRRWKEDPQALKIDIKRRGLSLPCDVEDVENYRPYTQKEIAVIKARLLACSIGTYFAEFPEEIEAGLAVRVPILRQWKETPNAEQADIERLFESDARYFPRTEHDVYMLKMFVREHAAAAYYEIFPDGGGLGPKSRVLE